MFWGKLMFKAYIAFAVELLALAAGTFLLASLHKGSAFCNIFSKIVSYFVIILSLIVMALTFEYFLRYREVNEFKIIEQDMARDPDSMHTDPGD
jgi:hypothetical protein